VIGLTACTDDGGDTINSGDPVGAQAEASIEKALTEVVGPLSGLLNSIESLINAPVPPAAGSGIGCPSMTGLCTSGTATCTPEAGSLRFDFGNCNIIVKQIVADGEVLLTPTGASTFNLNLTDLSLAGASPLNGTLSVDEALCIDHWFVDSDDGVGVVATFKGCDDYPESGSVLTVTVTVSPDVWSSAFTFDGTSAADVLVDRNDSAVATCDVNLDTFNATCSSF